jgi:hypothetical protein
MTGTADVCAKFADPVQQQEIQGTGLSAQAPISTNNGTLKVTIIVQQIMAELSEAVSGKHKIMVITKMVLNLVKQNDC